MDYNRKKQEKALFSLDGKPFLYF